MNATCRITVGILLSLLYGAGCAGPARVDSAPVARQQDAADAEPAEEIPQMVRMEAAMIRRAATDSGLSESEARGLERTILQAQPADRDLLMRCVYGHLNYRKEPATDQVAEAAPADQTSVGSGVVTLTDVEATVTPPEHRAGDVRLASHEPPTEPDTRSTADTAPVSQLDRNHDRPADDATAHVEQRQQPQRTPDAAPAEPVQSVAGNRSLRLPSTQDDLTPSDSEQDDGSWHRNLRMAAVRLRRELDEQPDMDPVERSRRQTALSLMHLIAQDSEQAIEALEGLDDHEMEFWRQTLVALDILMDGEAIPKLRHRVENASEHLENGLSALSNLGPLRLDNLSFVDEVKSYGAYREIGGRGFSPGELVFVYVEVSNFAVEEVTSQDNTGLSRHSQRESVPLYECDLLGRCDILDENQRVVMSKTLGVTRDRWRKQRRDFYIAYDFRFPQLTAGDYTFELTIEDKKGQKYGNAAMGFHIR